MHPNPREKYFDQFYVSEVDDEFQVLDMGDIQIIYLESPWTEENDLDALQTVMFSAIHIILEEISRKQTNKWIFIQYYFDLFSKGALAISLLVIITFS